MSVAVTDLGFVTVAGKLEPSAIAGEVAREAHNRVAEAVTLTLNWLEDDGRPLNERQKVQFLECVLRCMDGFERAVLDDITRAIEKANDAS